MPRSRADPCLPPVTASLTRTRPLRTTALAAVLVLLSGLAWSTEAFAATPDPAPEAPVSWTVESGARTVGRLGVALTRGLPPAVQASDARSRTTGLEGGDAMEPSSVPGARLGHQASSLLAGSYGEGQRAASGLERCRLSGVFRL